MKILCNTTLLSEACLNVQRASAQKATIPSLEGILIKTNGQGIELSGYDLEMGINTFVDAKVEQEGSVVINAKTFCEILRHLPKSTVSLETDEKNVCLIKSEDSEFSLIGFSAADFPDMPVVMGGIPVVLPQTLLRDMIRQTIFAVSFDDLKTVHKGIKFEITDNKIQLIALDGYRLAIRNENIEYTGEPISFIVPAKTLSEVVKFINDENGFISIALGKQHIVFNINGYNIVSRLLEGAFLNYKTAIPEGHTLFVSANTREIIESIERISLVISEKTKSPVRCVFDEGSIRLSCTTAIGAATDKLMVDSEGESLEIGLNNRFLLDALRAIESDIVHIKLNSPIMPVIITPPEGEGFLYIIVPARLRDEGTVNG